MCVYSTNAIGNSHHPVSGRTWVIVFPEEETLEMLILSTQSTTSEPVSLWTNTDFQCRIWKHCQRQTAELPGSLVWSSVASQRVLIMKLVSRNDQKLLPLHLSTASSHTLSFIFEANLNSQPQLSGYFKLYQGWEYCKSGRKL